ncbi:MAG: NUDIX hydrolase [Deltaproteobacteria bacterium]
MELIEQLDLFFKSEACSLPGYKSQNQMSPPHRYDLLKYVSGYVDAAVAILLYKKNDDYYFPVIKRTSGNYNHSGQISLPGGKKDDSDVDLAECALRELEEELGIGSNTARISGQLSELLIPVSNFRVQPYVFITDQTPDFKPQLSEVEYIIEVNMNDLMDDSNIKNGKITLQSGFILDNIPYFYINSHIIWGATAMILSEFKNVCINLKTK